LLDVNDLRLRRYGGDELVPAVREAPASTTVARCDDDSGDEGDDTDDDARDRAGIGFTAIVTATVLTSRYIAPRAALFVDGWTPVLAIFAGVKRRIT